MIKSGGVRLAGIIIISLLIGCVTTQSSAPKKWATEERSEVHVKLGMTYLQKDQYETARLEFDSAIEINPKSDSAHHAKGLLFSKLGNDDLATSFFAKAVSLNPSNFLAVNDYAIHLCQQNDIDKGLAYLRKIENDPANNHLLVTHLGLGVCHFQGDQYDIANKYFRIVLDQSPRLPQALMPMAEISFSDNQLLSARGFLERFFDTGAVSERALYLAARVEKLLGDESKAHQYRNALLQRYPLSSYNNRLDSL